MEDNVGTGVVMIVVRVHKLMIDIRVRLMRLRS